MITFPLRFISVPPSNLNVETMPSSNVYYGIINETVNCTANMNPSTTVLSLIGKLFNGSTVYSFAEKTNSQTIVDSDNKIGCYPTVRTVFNKLDDFLEKFSWVGCLANDAVTGQSYITEFKFVVANIIT